MRQKKIAAKNILKTKIVLFNGVIVEMKIWEVIKSDLYLDGYKFPYTLSIKAEF